MNTKELFDMWLEKQGLLHIPVLGYESVEGDLSFLAFQSGYDAAISAMCEWIIDQGLATGHGEFIEDILQHLDEQLRERYTKGESK